VAEGREGVSSALLSASVASIGATATLESLPELTRKVRPRRTGPRDAAAAKRTHRPYVPGSSRRSFAASSDSGGSLRPTDTSSVMGRPADLPFRGVVGPVPLPIPVGVVVVCVVGVVVVLHGASSKGCSVDEPTFTGGSVVAWKCARHLPQQHCDDCVKDD